MLEQLNRIPAKIWSWIPSENFDKALKEKDENTLKKEYNIEKTISEFFLLVSLSYFSWLNHVTYIDVVDYIEEKLSIINEKENILKDVREKFRDIIDY